MGGDDGLFWHPCCYGATSFASQNPVKTNNDKSAADKRHNVAPAHYVTGDTTVHSDGGRIRALGFGCIGANLFLHSMELLRWTLEWTRYDPKI